MQEAPAGWERASDPTIAAVKAVKRTANVLRAMLFSLDSLVDAG